MYKFLLLWLCFNSVFLVKGQYNAFPKLESLYSDGKYDKCLEKAEEEIKESTKEIFPYIWQMRCYIAIDELDAHILKKNALTKALNIAIKIKAKDKKAELTDELKGDFEILKSKIPQKAMALPDGQYATGISLFDKLILLTGSMDVEYSKYLFMKDHSDEYAFSDLKELVEKHYRAFKTDSKSTENLEEAYAALMEWYFARSHPDYAKQVYFKALEVYKKGTLCKVVFIEHVLRMSNNIGYYSDEETLVISLKEIESADSLFSDPAFKPVIIKINKFLAIDNIRNQPINSTKTIASIMHYLAVFNPSQYDSSDAFFDNIFVNNQSGYGRIETKKLYNYWIKTKQEIKKLNQANEPIKSIHQYYILQKRYDEDYDFLSYCKSTYPNLKTLIVSLNIQLEKLVLEHVSSDSFKSNPALIDEYANKMNSKEIKEKQFKNYYSKLSALLTDQNFSGFAVNMVKALAQYPGDPRFLTLKKRWVIEDYKANYLRRSGDYGYEQYFTKLPNEATCEPGIVNKKGHDVVLQKINYCRRLAGVPDSCILDDGLNVKCQKTALMMSANDQLSHSPPETWKCYTKIGAGTAGSSNLSLGNAFNDAIMGQMTDGGENNYSCGHRRWILNPNNMVFGHGSTLNASALNVFGTSNSNIKGNPRFNLQQPVCWPSTDYFPRNLIPSRWSFSLSSVNFEKAKVTVTEGGKNLPLRVEPFSQGYGMNSIIFVIDGEIETNKTYIVTVSNVIPYWSWGSGTEEEKSKPRTFSYKVIPIDIE